MSLSLPRFQQGAPLVDANGLPTTSFHIWWDNFASSLETALNDIISNVAAIAAAQAAAAAAQADATNALNQLTDIASDNKLSPVEKTIVIKDYNVIITEQTDIDTKATTYGITTEKTNYDNAVSALTTYLGTLTTPVAWNDTSGTTDITGTTFRSKFQDVYTTKQLLLNKMHNSAKTLADTAQSTADTVHVNDSVSSSWTSPGVILSASDAGTSATITISNHTRKYNDASGQSVTGSSITGLAYNTTYFIYYDDNSRSGGAVSYQATTNPNLALPGAATGRHYCGEIKTPVAGGTGTSGGVSPPGSGGQLGGSDIP